MQYCNNIFYPEDFTILFYQFQMILPNIISPDLLDKLRKKNSQCATACTHIKNNTVFPNSSFSQNKSYILSRNNLCKTFYSFIFVKKICFQQIKFFSGICANYHAFFRIQICFFKNSICTM